MLIAKLLGAVYLFAGLGILVNGTHYQKAVKELLDSNSFKFMGGMLATLAGVLVISYHNIWSGPWWVILITIFGWLGLAKGFFYFVFPQAFKVFLPLYKKQYMPLWALLMLIFGGIFAYYGFLI